MLDPSEVQEAIRLHFCQLHGQLQLRQLALTEQLLKAVQTQRTAIQQTVSSGSFSCVTQAGDGSVLCQLFWKMNTGRSFPAVPAIPVTAAELSRSQSGNGHTMLIIPVSVRPSEPK